MAETASIVSPIDQIRVRTRTFDAGAVLGRATDIVRRRGLLFSLVALVLIGGCTELANQIATFVQRHYPANLPLNIARYAFGVVSVLVSSTFTAWVALVAADDASGRSDGPLIASVPRILSRMGPLIVSTVVWHLGVYAATLLFIAPGAMLAVAWIVYLPVVAVERCDAMQALSRSARLTQGHRWPIFGLAVAFWISVFVVEFAATKLASPGSSFVHALRTPQYVFIAGPLVVAFSRIGFSIGAAALYVELAQVSETSSIESVAKVFA